MASDCTMMEEDLLTPREIYSVVSEETAGGCCSRRMFVVSKFLLRFSRFYHPKASAIRPKVSAHMIRTFPGMIQGSDKAVAKRLLLARRAKQKQTPTEKRARE